MSAIYKNGIAYGGAASAANLISATDAEGAATNVQAELNNINENISSLNDDLMHTQGSGTLTNQYCSCQYWWVKDGSVASVTFMMTPFQNITRSSGTLVKDSQMPAPFVDTGGAVLSISTPEDEKMRYMTFSYGGNIYFYGPYTKDLSYKAAITFNVTV